MSRIVLVPSPTYEKEDGHWYPSRHVPLGLLCVAGAIRPLAVEVKVVDINALRADGVAPVGRRGIATMAEVIAARQPDIVGFSTICDTYHETILLARAVKERRPDVLVLLGGPQASVADEATLTAFPWIDVVVRGEADELAPMLLQALLGGAPLATVQGVSFRRASSVVRNPATPPVTDLDRLPIPAYDLVRIEDASSYVPIDVGRGCPFECVFCSTAKFFARRYRVKSPRRIIQELGRIYELHGTTRFSLDHDLLTLNERYIRELCMSLKTSGLPRVEWTCSARTDHLAPALLQQMRDAGCRHVFVGIETGSPRMQRAIGKRLDLRSVPPVVASAAGLGMKVTTSFIVGFPEESRDDMNLTLRMVADMAMTPVIDVNLHPLWPYKGSQMQRTHEARQALDPQFLPPNLFTSEDVELLRAHPETFSSLWHLDLDWISRADLVDGVEFFLWLLQAYRCTTVFLARRGADCIGLFARWARWMSTEHGVRLEDLGWPEARHRARVFPRAGEFLRREIAGVPEHEDILAFEDAVHRLAASSAAVAERPAEASLPLTQDSVLGAAGGVAWIATAHDVDKLIAILRAGGTPQGVAARRSCYVLRVAPGNELRVLRVSPFTDALLHRCEGQHTVSEIACELAAMADTDEANVDTLVQDALNSLVQLQVLAVQGAGLRGAP